MQTEAILTVFGPAHLVGLFADKSNELCIASRSLIESMLNGISKIHQFREDKVKHEIHKEKMGTPHGSKFKPLKLGKTEFCISCIICIFMLYYILYSRSIIPFTP